MVSGEVRSGENEQFLRDAFRSFAGAAASLERSYGTLRREVERLHGELAESNAGLARSLEENRAMRRHLDRILDGLPCGVLVEKTDGAISLLNPEGRRLLRVASAAVGGEGSLAASCESFPLVPGALRELLDRARSAPGEQEQCFDRHIDGCIAGSPEGGTEVDMEGEEGEVREVREVRETGGIGGIEEVGSRIKDGSDGECWLAVRHAAVPEGGERDSQKAASPGVEAGDDAVSIFILRDVSAAKRLVREREKLGREQALAEIVAILAHEIRNPLGSLELFAGLLAGAGLSAQCREWVEHVQAGLRTLAATVNNVLHFHSLPAPQRVPTDLGRLLDWAGGFLVPMARQAHVELCLRNRLQGVWFPAERHRLEQVLLNLVLNALRAMPGGGWVEVAGHQVRHGDAAAIAISVSDTGPGIAPEQARKIFEPGFSTRRDGPGLGLAVCKKIVEQHGGSLAATNRTGSGACFTLMFPLQKAASANQSGPEVRG
jgi:signal transduction histidine kinase